VNATASIPDRTWCSQRRWARLAADLWLMNDDEWARKCPPAHRRINDFASDRRRCCERFGYAVWREVSAIIDL